MPSGSFLWTVWSSPFASIMPSPLQSISSISSPSNRSDSGLTGTSSGRINPLSAAILPIPASSSSRLLLLSWRLRSPLSSLPLRWDSITPASSLSLPIWRSWSPCRTAPSPPSLHHNWHGLLRTGTIPNAHTSSHRSHAICSSSAALSYWLCGSTLTLSSISCPMAPPSPKRNT